MEITHTDNIRTILDIDEVADVAGHLTDVIGEALDGRNASVTDGVEQVLGGPARDFADDARNAAAAGAWEPLVAATGPRGER